MGPRASRPPWRDPHPQALADAAAASRHEAAEHIAVIEKSVPVWKMLGVIVAVAAVLFGAVAVMNYLGADAKIAAAVNAADVRVVPSLPAQIAVVTLDDGSTVRLAPESKLSIPQGFGPDLRAVKIEGAGTFPWRPASRRTSRCTRATPSSSPRARVHRAQLRGRRGDDRRRARGIGGRAVGDETQALAAGAALVVAIDRTTRPSTAGEADEAAGWNTGTLAVTNRPLREVLPLSDAGTASPSACRRTPCWRGR